MRILRRSKFATAKSRMPCLRDECSNALRTPDQTNVMVTRSDRTPGHALPQ